VGRAKLFVASAVALVACVAGVASAEPSEQLVSVPAASEGGLERLPTAEDVGEALAKAEREEAEREAWLASPEAVQEREESRFAYAGLDPAAARALLSAVFAEQLAQLNTDPARVLSDVKLLSVSDETTATVEDEGDGMLLESSLPVRTEDEDGDLGKVDLGLEETGGGFETENALVEVQIPASVDQAVEVGQGGVAIKLAGADQGRSVEPFGEANALATEVLPDTDMLISPIATGVEIFNVLRSERSPETLRFGVEMPAGAELRDREWGAGVLKNGELLAVIREPVAVDAQGTDVPVELAVEGDSLLLTVDHREGDYALPILLDPILEDNSNWIYGQHHNALDMELWVDNANAAAFRTDDYCIVECFGPGGSGTRGLYVSSKGQQWYAPKQFGQWSYSAPNIHSYISSVTLGAPYVRADHGCSSPPHNQPHDYFGVWSANLSAWVYLSVGSANYPGGHYTLPFAGDAVITGLGSGEGGNFFMPCVRDLYAGGAQMWLDDWNPPWIEWVNGVPSGWVSDETQFTISARASDEGLGVQNIAVHPQGTAEFHHEKEQDQCAGDRRDPCIPTYTATFTNPGDRFLEGERTAFVEARDPTGEKATSSNFTMKVDKTPPEVTLDGQLAEITEEDKGEELGDEKVEKLRLPVYNLTIKAEDGKPNAELKDKRSGVKDIEIYLDGVEQEVPWEPQPCSGPNFSCPMTKTYPVQLSTLTTAGEHKLKVEAVDHVGKRLKREIEFEYFPATGIKDSYTMHYFPLPDGSGNEAEEEHPARPELAVNVMNGNLVYREQDVDVEGAAAVDLEVERYYNSQLPSAEDSEFGDGWTLAETPQLEPVDTGGTSAPDEAELLDASGVIEDGVELPTEAGAERFDPALRVTLTKKAEGGYELRDETGESATSVAFDETGQTEALLTESFAKVDYTYEAGELSEIEVVDPATVGVEDPSELQIPEPPPFSVPDFAYAFGVWGEDDGEFEVPADVAVGPEGDVWVVDAEANRVQRFSRWGHYLGQFGSEGTGDGQFRWPTAIEIDQDGDLWVLDSYNDRVQKFNPEGDFLAKWGAFGSAPGQLNTPEGLAIDAEGNFWISDTWNGRIQKFTENGALLEVAGASGEGDLNDPAGLAVGPDGEVFVADWAANRVLVFDKSGDYLRKFGSEGSGEGQFHHPVAVEVDTQGNVFVSDENDEQLEQFDSEGNFLAQHGGEGDGDGEFEFSRPMGITTNAEGGLWITDSNNNRVQFWTRDGYRPSHEATVGSFGAGNGQYDLPGDIDVDSEGDLWIVDTLNNRVQQLDSEGDFKSKFGVLGSANGQLNRPSAIEIDAQDNIWVADAGNDRVQKFSQAGQYLTKLGGSGTANGKLDSPEGIAIDQSGDIWVSDTWNDRVQRFSAAGTFLKAFGTAGLGDLHEPLGIDVVHGEVFVADWDHNRIVVFDEAGEYLREFGEEGYGPGQFRSPTALEIDSGGNVWVSDEGNERILQFNVEGEFVTHFGSEGTGEDEFELTSPSGIASDDTGSLWVTDSANDRLQRWETPGYVPAPEPQLTDADPAVEVDVSSGLVEELSGEEAGEHSYTHSGDDLTAHEGPDGETKYEYDGGLLTKVTLANGTWGEIEYHAEGRVKSVTVDPAGSESAKTTHFEYTDDPRRTFVEVPGAPNVTYDIGEDGSVLKWWHEQQPPEFLDISGSLWIERETEIAIGDHTLSVIADSPEGIASIQFIANGDTLIDEKACEQTPEPGVECTELENIWVTDTGSNAPGRLELEVLVTDHDGNVESERFWVDVPYTPPPPAGVPAPPRFKDVLRFRQEYGLEVVFPVASENELTERVFDLIHAWHNPQSPEGEVARASWERWGVPLRPADVAELDYREWFYDVNAEKIDQWVEATSPGSYAGYYMDHPAGGVMHIGFIDNQAEQLDSLETSLSLVGGSRLSAYPTPPTTSYLSVRATAQSVLGALESNSTLANLVVSVEDDEAGKATRVGTPNVAQVESILDQMLGANAPVAVEYEAGGGALLEGRYRNKGRMRAGDYINGSVYTPGGIEAGERRCTAGFGAKHKVPKPGGSGELVRLFLLTAGHCYTKLDTEVWRAPQDESQDFDDAGKSEVGRLARNALQYAEANNVRTDGAAIRIKQGGIVPLAIWGWDGHALPTEPPGRARKGNTVCYSGAISKTVACGRIVARSLDWADTDEPFHLAGYWVRFPEGKRPKEGDSGSPVWNRYTGASIGLVSAGRPEGSFEETLVAPLLHPPNMPSNRVPGILHHVGMAPLQLKLGG